MDIPTQLHLLLEPCKRRGQKAEWERKGSKDRRNGEVITAWRLEGREEEQREAHGKGGRELRVLAREMFQKSDPVLRLFCLLVCFVILPVQQTHSQVPGPVWGPGREQ